MQTVVVNIKNEPYDVYIGRAGHGKDGYFGNPYVLGAERQRVSVLVAYEYWFYARLERDQEFKRRVLGLAGKRLGCFCKPLLCHGDIIADYLNNLRPTGT